MDVGHLAAEEGGTVEIDRVLCIGDGDKVTVGKPFIEGARVLATALKNGRGDKIIVVKFKAKTRYRRKLGHRQLFTRLTIDQIVSPGEETDKPKPVKKARQPKKEVITDGA